MGEDLEGRTLLSVGLDPTFGFGGESAMIAPQNTSTDTYSENISSIASQSGQVVEVGTLTTSPTASGSSSTTSLIVTRLTAAGSIDTSFGSNGTETIPVLTVGGTTYNVVDADDIAVDSNGKIDILATVDNSSTFDNEWMVARLNSNGSVNTSFGTSGFELIDFATSSSTQYNLSASSLAIGPDGKIVAVGSTSTSTTNGEVFAVARLNTNGLLDTSFNGTGMATVDFKVGGSSGESDTTSAVVVQPDDKIVVVGSAQLPSTSNSNGTPSDLAVARLNANGTLDTSFNGNGLVAFNEDLGGGSSMDSGNAVALQGTQIVIAGSSQEISQSTSSPTVEDLTVTRLNANGSFDTSFNGSGKYLLSLNQGGIAFTTSASAVTVQSDGSLLVGGSANPQNYNTSAAGGLLMHMTSAGALDTTYGTGGVALLPDSVDSRLLIQTDGKALFLSGNEVVRTTAPTPQVASTTIITTGTGKKAEATGVTLTFNTAVNPSLASNAKVYLIRAGKGRKLIKIKKVSYDATKQALTFSFAKTPVGKGFRILIAPGGIVAADGQVLNNDTITIAPSTT